MNGQLTLGDFVKHLTAQMQREKVVIPFKNERPWHILFYELKKARERVGRPLFLDQLHFDWDGPYPKSQELSEFLDALHWNASVSASNPRYETMALPDDVAELWADRITGLDNDTKRFLSEAIELARVEFA